MLRGTASSTCPTLGIVLMFAQVIMCVYHHHGNDARNVDNKYVPRIFDIVAKRRPLPPPLPNTRPAPSVPSGNFNYVHLEFIDKNLAVTTYYRLRSSLSNKVHRR